MKNIHIALRSAPLVLFSFVGGPTHAAQEPFGSSQTIVSALWPVIGHADIDQDGDQDVLYASVEFCGQHMVECGLIWWVENLGDGSFGAFQPVGFWPTTYGPDTRVWQLRAGDFDGDGDLDVLARLDRHIAWCENLGGGNFDVFNPHDLFPPNSIYSFAVNATDLDGDGDTDVLANVLSSSSGEWEIVWLENLGGGSFGPPQVIQAAPVFLVVNELYGVDLDGDGDVDVLAASADELAWHENIGGGVFGPPTSIDTGNGIANRTHVVDLDGDGDADVLAASWHDETIDWYPNRGNGTFGPRQFIATQHAYVLGIEVGDLDGDGDEDVLAGSTIQGGRIAWYENLGSGAFGGQQVISAPGETASGVLAIDLDGDRDADVLAASAFDLSWYENLPARSNSYYPPHLLPWVETVR